MLDHSTRFAIFQALLGRNTVLRQDEPLHYQALSNQGGYGVRAAPTMTLDALLAEAEKVCAYIESTTPKPKKRRR